MRVIRTPKTCYTNNQLVESFRSCFLSANFPFPPKKSIHFRPEQASAYLWGVGGSSTLYGAHRAVWNYVCRVQYTWNFMVAR